MSRAAQSTTNDLQARAWGYYGVPGSSCHAVGEVRYVVGWLADQIARLNWRITIADSEAWTVTLADSEVIRSVPDSEDPTTDPNEASSRLLDELDWRRSVTQITTNLFVAGQGDFVQTDDGWRVVSVVDKNRKTLLEKPGVPFLWPHPADPTTPDAPLFSVLELLDELDWLTRQARTQSRQRVLISGVALIADGFEGPNGEDFWAQWNTALSARMRDPDDLSPIKLRGPQELIKDGFNWVVPPLGYDDTLDRRVTANIHRLAYGLPVPPEILLGMQAQSRATAFQVEENAYRAHIEPPAWMVARVASDALSLLLDKPVVVEPDATELLARRQSVQDVKDAYDRAEVDGDYLREVLGIPDDAKPDKAQTSAAVQAAIDLAKAAPSLAQDPGIDVLAQQIAALLEGNPAPALNDAIAATPAAKDPANIAADEPVTAAATGELSDVLAQVDLLLGAELAGASQAYVDRARQRLGAAARSNPTVREHSTGTSAEVAHTLGVQGLAAAGVDIDTVIAEPLDAAAAWWARRVGEAWAQVAQIVPGWAGEPEWVTESATVYRDALHAHIVESLDRTVPGPLSGDVISRVLDVASGSF